MQIFCVSLSCSIYVNFSQSVAREWRDFKLQQQGNVSRPPAVSPSGSFQRANQQQPFAQQQRASQQRNQSVSRHPSVVSGPQGGLAVPEGKHRSGISNRELGNEYQRGSIKYNVSRGDTRREEEIKGARTHGFHGALHQHGNWDRRSRSRSAGRR